MATALDLTRDGISYNIKQIILNIINKYIEETKKLTLPVIVVELTFYQ